MLTTGLVSLNVHEALTFDGTEIVLHPDLFAADGHNNVTSIGNSARHPSNIRPSPSAGTGVSSVGSASTVATNVDPSAQQQGQPQSSTSAGSQPPPTVGLAPAVSSDGGKLAWTGGVTNTGASQRRLEVGDMIEIRVWDPIPLQNRHPSPGGVSAVFRKRSAASVSSGGSASTEAQKSSVAAATSKKVGIATPSMSGVGFSNVLTLGGATASAGAPSITTKAQLESVTSNLSRKMSLATSNTSESMQYSDCSTNEQATTSELHRIVTTTQTRTPTPSKDTQDTASADDTRAAGNRNTMSAESTASLTSPISLPCTKTVITVPNTTNNATSTVSGKPPIFGGALLSGNSSRRTQSELPRLPSTSGAALPKPPLQPRASTHGDTSFAAYYESRKRSAKPIHSREISDMTADSMVHGLMHNFPPQSSQHSSTGNANSSSNNPLDFNLPLGVDIIDREDPTETGRGGDDEDDNTQGDDTLSLIGKTHVMRFSFVIKVTEKTLTSLKGSARTQVSVLRQVADLYNLSSYDMVSINRIDKEDEAAVLTAVSADFVLLSIKDQFISRGDMHLFQKSLVGSWVYEGQRLSEAARGIKAHAWLIRHGNQPAKSGIVTEDTMITFRSRSSRIFWLVQIAAESFDYASPFERERGEQNESVCEIYFDRWISFVYRLFDKWKALEVTHSLTVVFFSRTFLSSRQAITVNADGGTLDCRDVYGRPYEDHYKMVIENETRADRESLVVRLKEEFLKYPLEVGWNLSTGDLGRRPSNASQGNVLEAINITSNLLQFHYLDRDLHRTGNSIVLITPGCGVFEVDKGLASITFQRMLDNGIGSDMLSLGLPPLHIAPFFLYNNEYRTVESRGVDTNETYYEIPHWMHLAFISYEDDPGNAGQIPSRDVDGEALKQFRGTGNDPQVAANGFILPQNDSFDSLIPSKVKVDPSSPTSFSVNGIAASSPEKPLREWTSMDLDLDEPCKVIRPRSGSFGLHDKNSERSDGSVLSSPGSSYTTSSLVGMHFDRRQKGGTSLGGIHLQRATSLQNVTLADGHDDTETVKSDGSLSTMGPDMDPGTDEDLASLKAAEKERIRSANMLRKLMAKHDSNYFEVQTAAAPTADPIINRTQLYQPLNESVRNMSPLAPTLSVPSNRFPANRSGNEPTQSGGIGAALSHYTVSHEVMAGVNDSVSNRIRVMNPGDGVGVTSRTLSSGSRNPQFSDLGARAMSPLLLPPPGVPFGASLDPPDLVRPEDRQLASRLLPRDFRALGGARDGASSRSLNTLYSGRGVGASTQPSFVEPTTEVRTSINKRQEVTSRSGVANVGASSPRAGDMYRGNQGRSQRNRESTTSHRHARKKAFNPFRQADEDKVLAKRSHNRRRWSHVFPQGEVEFKRHAGPAWRSLCCPAILPLSVDYFPSRQEIDQYFQFNIYNVTLSDFENTPYSTHGDVMMEMLRQRISQDYQLVTPSCVDETVHRANPAMGRAPYGSGRASSVIPKLPKETNENERPIKHFLTMGHQLQEITYDPSTDTIEVVRFNERDAQNDKLNTFKYQYLLFSPLLQKYTKVVATFKKYADQYNWNKVDRIICGADDRSLREGMRFRRIMFGLIPPKFTNAESEQEYIAKFKRLNPAPNLYETRAVTGVDSMQRSTVQLRKGKHDPFEWIELATDSEFSTLKSFRILFNWLAASSGKVETQAQLLHRRCSQYGLSLTFFPQTSISRDLLLDPFKSPPTFCVRDDDKAKALYTSILALDFINDGVFYTQTRPILQCIENGAEFDFGRRLSTAARQFVHRSGTLFVRLIRDRRGWVICVVIPNGSHIKKDEDKRERIAKSTFKDLVQLIGSLTEDDEEDEA
ncbi:GATOR complex protein DEPDC5 [Seminavis robusta]|uniref:GATOR complex protein DEPDC5 n=1 Tax=Seminavis robusta TaxID=568900 RepID=A0A9N8HKT5_9STRA|nr:GATOR complex protein DEPDC5 [Seminavis robusta]|eukprot:Sro635_g179140.1 GATOR complex protein DEPDC5 (1838) ;mRNA; r:27957-34844